MTPYGPPGKEPRRHGVPSGMALSHTLRPGLLTTGIVLALAIPAVAGAAVLATGPTARPRAVAPETVTVTVPARRPAAGGLDASVDGMRPARPRGITPLVARHPGLVVSTLRLDDAVPGCRPGELAAQARAQATLTPSTGLTLARGVPRTRLVAVPTGGFERPASVNASWSLRVARSGIFHARVRWSLLAATGRACTADQAVAVVATAAAPGLRAVGVSRFRGDLVVPLRSTLPGLSGAATATQRRGAYAGFFSEPHALGRTGRGVLDLLRPTGAGRFVALAVDFDHHGLACLLVRDPYRRPTFTYRLGATWNRALGVETAARPGVLRVHEGGAVSKDGRRCRATIAGAMAGRHPG